MAEKTKGTKKTGAKKPAPKEKAVKESKDQQPLTVCSSTQEMIDLTRKAGIETVFDRAATMKPCPIGADGSCCKNCSMGPCRVPKPKKEGDPQKVGLCGATAETIAARNFARMVAAGSSAHSDHGRGVAEVFLMAAKGEIPGYGVKDEQKLVQVAMDFDIDVENKPIKDIAIELGELCVAEFGKQEGELTFAKRAPLKRQELWKKNNMMPRGIDREIVELMHRTHMGVDQDYKNITTQAARAALGDGWGGAMIATELQDILFGTPVPGTGEINLGVLKEDEVNIIGGRIRGIAGVVGCNNPRGVHDFDHLALIKELIRNDVIVLTTGCAAMACGKEGLLLPESAKEYCGSGLAEICETVGIPPVLHLGACVDNSRILVAATAVVKEGGLGDDISELPAAGAAPGWMSEKAIAIGHYFVASGVYTLFGTTFPTLGSAKYTDYLFRELEEEWGGKWDYEPDPMKMAEKMIAHIDKKRKELGIDKARERVLYDMEMRRDLESA